MVRFLEDCIDREDICKTMECGICISIITQDIQVVQVLFEFVFCAQDKLAKITVSRTSHHTLGLYFTISILPCKFLRTEAAIACNGFPMEELANIMQDYLIWWSLSY